MSNAVLSETNVLSVQDIKTIGVIGGGQMGNGIAQVAAASAGLNVIIHDMSADALGRAEKTIEKSLAKFVEKEKITASDKEKALAHIHFEQDFNALNNADVVVEAIVESEAVKIDVFKKLDALLKPEAILASNTSSISITRLAAATKRPSQVIGMHFMNPVPLMKLVEIIRGAQTSDTTYQTINALSQNMGKTTVVARDFPGFISNRILMPLLNEAMFAVYEGIGSPEDIDTVMKLGMNHPMGPLTLADFIGLDTCLSVINVLYEGFNDARFRPCPLLKQYVDAGYLGRKSGRGFFVYD